ncbi:MAG TPA: hypothetical protein VI232_14945, partial [Reyranella sp.]
IVAAADSLGALLVCGVMVRAAWELAVNAVPDLLDRSTSHIAGPALERAAGALPAGFALEASARAARRTPWCSKWRSPAPPAPTWRWPSMPNAPWRRRSPPHCRRRNFHWSCRRYPRSCEGTAIDGS